MNADTEWLWGGPLAGIVPDPTRREPGEVSCLDLSPSGLACTRSMSHSGRHVAGGTQNKALAAWPGAHPPTDDDAGAPS